MPSVSPTTSAAPAPTPSAPAAILPTLKGDESLPEPWRTGFRKWLSKVDRSPYVAVTETFVTSNSVAVLLWRHTDADGICREGPSRLGLIDEGGPELNPLLEHFGDDCCPGQQCTRGPDGWNLRYLALLAAKNWKELALLVPAKKKLTSMVNGEKPIELSRSDVAKGRFSDAPSCGLMYNETGCSELEGTRASFTCRCDGGGYHVTYEWEREGDGFVLVSISESSH